MMNIMRPKDTRNLYYRFIGAVVIVLNYIRHRLAGYQTPRTFDVTQVDKAVDYDLKITERWNSYLRNYLKNDEPFRDKIVLELGPGPDLGTGLITLATGAKKYIALDVNNLANSAPPDLYEKLFEKLLETFDDSVIQYVKEQLNYFNIRKKSNLEYIVDKDFSISGLKEKVDLVISQVAFEHFDNIEETIKEIGKIIKKGGVLYSHVDMKTHTRWIKDRDPLNIYRYGDLFWNMFKFKGSPNRIRMFQYKTFLERNGWYDVFIEPRTVVEEEYLQKVQPSLNKYFGKLDSSEMRILSFIVMAYKR